MHISNIIDINNSKLYIDIYIYIYIYTHILLI